MTEPKSRAIGYGGASASLFRWVGSKNRLARYLLEETRKIKHVNYVEPFGGAAALMMHKPPAKGRDVYNDTNKLLVNLFRVVRDPSRSYEFERLASIIPSSRVVFVELRELCIAWFKEDKETFAALKKEQRLDAVDDETAAAYAFFYAQNNGYAGKFLDSSFGRIKNDDHHPYNLGSHVPAIKAARERMRRVQIECLDWREIVDFYDIPKTLFYIDPPYDTGTSRTYQSGWNADSSSELVDRLLTLKASAIVSCYDSDVYRRLERAGWERKTFRVQRTIDSPLNVKRKEQTETIYVKNNSPATECGLLSKGEL